MKKIGFITLFAILALPISMAHAVLTRDDLEKDPRAGSTDEFVCPQAWPVDCTRGSGGSTGCGGWQIIKDLAEPEVWPDSRGNACSTGVRIGLGNRLAEGQPVGAMFPGTVIFSQSGDFRSGDFESRDYGGVVIIELNLDDGSPQCYLRYMFLDRRDLVKTGTTVEAGQQIGSVASSDMNVTKDWWRREWPQMQQSQVKIDIGCDEALVNYPQFMPFEPYTGSGPQDEQSCPLTKLRFPTPPLEYLASFDAASNAQCRVGFRTDARGQHEREGVLISEPQDNSELTTSLTGQYVEKVKPRGFIKRKTTPVRSTFGNANTREDLWNGELERTGNGNLFRNHSEYAKATNLRCANMERVLNGQGNTEATPEEIREYLTHCSNQYILGRSMAFQVYEQAQLGIAALNAPLPMHLREFLDAEERVEYEDWLAAGADNRIEVQHLIDKVFYRELCQPLAMQTLEFQDYDVEKILDRSWYDLLVQWPIDNGLGQINNPPMKEIEINDYADYPYERIIDPAHPFSPRHIFAETDRERYRDYGVQCAKTPVDLILGRFGDGIDRDMEVLGARDTVFHSCIKCRIDLNETREACIPDPFSFTNAGGCDGGFGPLTADGELCTNLDPALKTLMSALEAEFGLYPNLLHAVATAESGCSATATSPVGAQGMFQFMPATAAAYGINPWDPEQAARGSARYYKDSADTFDCDLPLMLASYNCGPGCAAQFRDGIRTSLPTETQGYITKIQAMLGGSATGCSVGGPAGGGVPGAGGGTGGGDVFGGGPGTCTPFTDPIEIGDPGATEPCTPGAPVGLGGFDPSGCPGSYVGNANAFDNGTGGKCPPLSYPTPDLAGLGFYGCHGRFFYPPGCDGACQARFNSGCTRLRGYPYSPKSIICTDGCPGRIHEGMDIAFEFGVPVYASADGVVRRINSSGYVFIDHSGACIDPACTKRFGNGVETRYYHMGMDRVIVAEGDNVTRCQQIGSVGDKNIEGVPHLHYEARDVGSKMFPGDTFGYYALDQTERYHAHVEDKSCTGGLTDAEARMGDQGICKMKLPVEVRGQNDLDPPPFLEDFDYKNVEVPVPGSEGHHTVFDHEVGGMIYEGAWTRCTDPLLPPDAETLCTSLNEDNAPGGGPGGGGGSGSPVDPDPGATPPPATGSAGYINPIPCGVVTSEFGMRVNPVSGILKLHGGVDIADGQSPTSVPLLAASGGTISIRSSDPSYGNFTQITHADGSVTRYAHQSSACPLTIGQNVVQGQVIGFQGATGNVTGSHLHFEVKETATTERIDPQPLIPAQAPGAPMCASYYNATCGNVISGQPTGGGLGGAVGKTLCIQKPCSLRYDHSDLVSQCAWAEDKGGCGTLGNYFQRYEGDSGGDCCYKATAPVAPLNTLKLRPGYDGEAKVVGAINANQRQRGGWPGVRVDDSNSEGLKGEGGNVNPSAANPGIPEGYTFHEHFRDHRPYMRWWDTGAESGNILMDSAEAESIDGSYDALVGVGVEKNSCGYGGWGDPELSDPNTSWMEMKLYQARSQYMTGLRCISRYEKMFKRGAAEDYVLSLAGGNFYSALTGTTSTSATSILWPLGWRGYVSEPVQALRFPYLISMPPTATGGTPQYTNATGALIGGGLDQALPGDILIWDEAVVGENRMPHVAYVVAANNEAMQRGMSGGGANPDYVLTPKRFFPPPERDEVTPHIRIADYNFGKYPDVCGNTNWWGVGPERTLYKGEIPENLSAAAQRRNIDDTSCDNTDLIACVENYWGDVKIYRPWLDVRD
ncbi:MAG: peptidoglycan DD-metalloendopeptidase family protein [Alphaproteobacteria bacterium]|nr:peptidoglycan DD-metalloendopeptidase family protein [Alphaproteobacteria bacterium]